jgi:CubicO group peptidase (beta-lactamase class C family)
MIDRIDAIAARTGVPGIQYLAVDGSRTLVEYAAGWADVAGERRMDPGTTMMLYSMSKTFTAAAVLQLIEAGSVALDDPVRKHLPGIPYDAGLLIRHLLSQTSGLPDPIPLKWVHLANERKTFDEQTALASVLAKHGRLRHPPGRRYGYSNIAYWLLGRVIERAAGTSFELYMKKNVFERLGIAPSEMAMKIPSVARHAKGYIPKWSFMDLFKSFLIDPRFLDGYEDRWYHINDHYLNGPAFGGIVASARAVAQFLQDQLRERSVLFRGSTKALFYEQQKDAGGRPVPMTLGWHVGNEKGTRHYYKEGGGGGFHSEMRIYPSRSIATVAIANDATFRAGKFLHAIDGHIVE